MESIDEDEFARWVPVRDAYYSLFSSQGIEVSKATLLRRLGNGVLRSAAEVTVWTEPDGRSRRQEREELASTVWQTFHPSHSFWISGESDVVLPRDLAQARAGMGAPTVALMGVRFDREGLAKVQPEIYATRDPTEPAAALPALTNVPDAPTKPLSGADYAVASRAIAAGWGTTITETEAWEKAKRLFPEHWVARDKFLALFRLDRGKKNPGKAPLDG